MSTLSREQFVKNLTALCTSAAVGGCWVDIESGLLAHDAALRAERDSFEHQIVDVKVQLMTAQATVERLEERLEMNYGFDVDGNRIPAPGIPDGIECRDETIRLQDTAIKALRASHAQLEEALGKLVVWAEEVTKDWYIDDDADLQEDLAMIAKAKALARRTG